MMPSSKDHRVLALWAADCAEHVLHHFEEQRPDDLRPRNAIEAGRAWTRGEQTVGEVRAAAFAAHAAARSVDHPAARAGARAAGHAAATAHVFSHAPHAATYAATAAGLAASEDPATATVVEREWQHHNLAAHLRPIVLR